MAYPQWPIDGRSFVLDPIANKEQIADECATQIDVIVVAGTRHALLLHRDQARQISTAFEAL